jgi:hypothetical protein
VTGAGSGARFVCGKSAHPILAGRVLCPVGLRLSSGFGNDGEQPGCDVLVLSEAGCAAISAVGTEVRTYRLELLVIVGQHPQDRFASVLGEPQVRRDALTTSHVRRVPADPTAITSALGRLGPRRALPSRPGPSLAQIEECLAAACATGDIAAAYIACAWLPEHVGDQTSRQTITRLAAALGARVAWQEPAGS